MMDDHDKTPPEPGSAEDLFPDTKPAEDPAKDVREKGEPDGGDNFA